MSDITEIIKVAFDIVTIIISLVALRIATKKENRDENEDLIKVRIELARLAQQLTDIKERL